MIGRSDKANRPYLYGNDYKVYCDFTGVPCASSDTKMTWDGFRVKTEYWQPRQPLDFPARVSPITSVQEARPQQIIFEEVAYPYLEFETSTTSSRILLSFENSIDGYLELE